VTQATIAKSLPYVQRAALYTQQSGAAAQRSDVNGAFLSIPRTTPLTLSGGAVLEVVLRAARDALYDPAEDRATTAVARGGGRLPNHGFTTEAQLGAAMERSRQQTAYVRDCADEARAAAAAREADEAEEQRKLAAGVDELWRSGLREPTKYYVPHLRAWLRVNGFEPGQDQKPALWAAAAEALRARDVREAAADDDDEEEDGGAGGAGVEGASPPAKRPRPERTLGNSGYTEQQLRHLAGSGSLSQVPLATLKSICDELQLLKTGTQPVLAARIAEKLQQLEAAARERARVQAEQERTQQQHAA
jgi:hypothetical protein